MSDIGNVGKIGQPIQDFRQLENPRSSERTSDPSTGVHGDVVDFSNIGEMLGKVKDLPDIRMDKIQGIREEVEANTYETPEKISITANRILREMLLG